MARNGVLLALGLMLVFANTGCYYDQWMQAKKANDVLREDLGRAKLDLQDCEMDLEKKNTQIDSMEKQIASKDETITTLTAEADNLREALAQAHEILKNLGRPIDTGILIEQKLPDPLHNKLQEFVDAHPGLVEYDAAKGAVRWKADLLFDLGSANLKASGESVESLQEFAQIVSSGVATGFDVVVVGHTCTTPIVRPETIKAHRTNWHLSAHRAISVMFHLSEMNVSMSRMGVMGYGEHRPIASNATNAGKAKNRRVEIYLVPSGSVRTMSQRNLRRVDGSELAFVPAEKTMP